jgi:hypothetical protein
MQLTCVPVTLAAMAACCHAGAALIPPSPTLFLRTNTVSGNATEFVQYTSLADLASNTASGLPNIDFPNHQVNDIFWDGTYYYRTYQSGGSKTRIYRWDSIEAYGDNAQATIFNLGTNWSPNDDFWCDQSGNFYRTNTEDNDPSIFVTNLASTSVVKYSSFSNLLSNSGGVTTNFQTDFGLGDRFWAYGNKFYKTTTGGGSTATIKTYASLAALGSNTAESTVSTTSYSTGDTFVFIPSPGALALLGVAGLACGRRRR